MTRWTPEQVLALAPDASSTQAARTLTQAAPWTATGAADDLVWGSCAGSGKSPYQAVVDLTGPAYRCTCPSRKFPCKHALALLLLWAAGTVPDAEQPADYAVEWKQQRDERDTVRAAKPQGERDEAAAAKRAGQRAERVAAGMQELERWLCDQVRSGLSRTAGKYGHAEPVAARLVDAQAPGVANTLRGASTIPASGDGWPARLLGVYGRLHLLARAHEQLDSLPADLAATVRSHVGYTTSRESVLAAAPITDDWTVLGVRDIPDASVPTRRTWLRGVVSGRLALLLAFDPRGQFGAHPDAMLTPGTVLDADLHFYPGRPPLRAVLGSRRSEPRTAPAPDPSGSFTDLLADWARALEDDPWLSEWPAVAFGTPVLRAGAWTLADPSGAAIPLLTGLDEPWPLLAVSGGHPVVVAGEWTAAGLRPLTVWDADTAVSLA